MNKKLQIDFEKLFLLALKEQEAELLEANLYWLYTIDRSTTILKRLFGSSKLSSAEKIGILRSGMNQSTAKTFYNVIKLFLDNKAYTRISYLYKGYVALLNEKLDRIVITVRASSSLDQKTQDDIRAYLKKHLNKEIVLHCQVDPALIGGLILQSSDGKIYDFSYKKMLSDIKFYILGEAK